MSSGPCCYDLVKFCNEVYGPNIYFIKVLQLILKHHYRMSVFIRDLCVFPEC